MVSASRFGREEDSDPDKKLFSVEQRKSQFEKKLFWLLLFAFLLLWLFVLQDVLLEVGQEEWGWTMVLDNATKRLPESRRK